MPPISEFLPCSPVEDMATTQTPTHGPAAEPEITKSTDKVTTATADSHRRETEAGDMDLDLVLRQDRQDLRAAMALFRREDRAEARTRYNDMMVLVTSLGHSGRKFRREATSRRRATVSEIYSAPRVMAAAARNPRLGIVPGVALDLTTTNNEGKPWDFNDPARRIEAEKLLDEQHPQLLIGSPMCTALSNIQNLNKAKRDPTIVEAEIEKARVHFRWCCRLIGHVVA